MLLNGLCISSINSGGFSLAHLAYHVHKSGRKNTNYHHLMFFLYATLYINSWRKSVNVKLTWSLSYLHGDKIVISCLKTKEYSENFY